VGTDAQTPRDQVALLIAWLRIRALLRNDYTYHEENWMAKKLAQIEAQIKKLQDEAASLRAKEVAGVVGRIKEAILHYGLTPEQLFGASRQKHKPASDLAVAPRKVRAESGKVRVKYRDGDNTWTGRGNKPRWLTARLGEGRKIEEFLV
jgi:DNA-binding protein H-NS